MVRFFAALASVTALLSAGSAMADELDVLTNVNAETIAPVFRNAGMRVEQTTISGNPALAIRDSGAVIILRPRVCAPDCKGLLMYAIFGGGASSSQMNAYNRETPATTVFTADGRTVLSRYLIADHGITEGTLMVNYNVFKGTLASWRQEKQRNPVQAVALSLAWPQTEYASKDEADDDAFLEAALDRSDLINDRN